MTIVPPSDRQLAPRVMPTVFSDFPATQVVNAARRDRATWFLLAVIAFVAAVVAGYFAYKFYNDSMAYSQESTRLSAENDNLRGQLRDFKGASDALTGMLNSRTHIAQMLHDKTGASSVLKRPALAANVAIYNAGDTAFWNNERQGMQDRLQARWALLQQLETEVDRYHPAGPAPPCANPSGCP